MNLRQLRFLCSVADSGFNITNAARALHASQPGLSKQLSALERELGVDILVRRGNRIVGCTAPGEAILTVARRMLGDAQTMRRISEDFGTHDAGRVVVATTHTHARYILPDVVESFSKRYPKVQLVLKQAYASGVPELVASGEADIGFSGESESVPSDIVMLPCYRLRRSLLARVRHPVLKARTVTIATIARYPIVAMDASFASGRRVLQTFSSAGENPAIVMTATDAEVIKWYVGKGLGIAVLPSIAFDVARDRGLGALDVSHLFEGIVTSVILRRNHYLLRYMLDFIQLLAPQWTRSAVTRALETGNVIAPQIEDHPLPRGRPRMSDKR